MNLAKYRNRHIDYVNDDFIRINLKTDDLKLLSNEKLKEVTIYHPTQTHIDNLPSILTGRIVAINIWDGNYKNCKSFEKLKGLQYISIHRNSKLESLWPLENDENLKGLGIVDCNMLQSIKFVECLTNLQELHIAGSMWKRHKIHTLTPISNLKNLVYLSLTQLIIEDANHQPLFNLQNLEELVLSENLFSTEQFAELAVLMKRTNCQCFKGYIELKEIYLDPAQCLNNRIQIVGFGKPELDPNTQARRIEKYILSFNELKERFETSA